MRPRTRAAGREGVRPTIAPGLAPLTLTSCPQVFHFLGVASAAIAAVCAEDLNPLRPGGRGYPLNLFFACPLCAHLANERPRFTALALPPFAGPMSASKLEVKILVPIDLSVIERRTFWCALVVGLTAATPTTPDPTCAP